MEAFFAVVVGICVGMYYNWKMALWCCGCIPFMVFGGAFMAKFQKGMLEDTAGS